MAKCEPKTSRNSTLPFIPSEKICFPEFRHAHTAVACYFSLPARCRRSDCGNGAKRFEQEKQRARGGGASFLPFYFPRSLTTPLSERLHFLRAFPPVNGLNNLVISSNITCCVFRICNEKTESLKLLAPMEDLVTNLKIAEDDSKFRYRNILFV